MVSVEECDDVEGMKSGKEAIVASAQRGCAATLQQPEGWNGFGGYEQVHLMRR